MQQQLGEANTALRAKEDECNRVAHEHDRLIKQLADQAAVHKTALKQAEDNEVRLLDSLRLSGRVGLRRRRR